MAGVTDPGRWAYLAEGNAKQARKRVAADVLLRDDGGRVLLVNPTYKDFWDLPGGMAEANESPSAAAEREVCEELGITVKAGRVLALEWAGPHGPWDDQLVFVFDAGTLAADVAAGLRPADDEVAELAFVTPEEARRRLRPDIAALVDRALAALAGGGTDYTERR
ncbi:NUDIX domain-containing protein [Amycolatopsis magusensis]|uniref:NUDIX domain-containing protein n=1 Tax=Amycolatopsis magusensis TaxID=882444 RepID=UPI0037AAA563